MLHVQRVDPPLLARAARWFNAQWGIPARVYAASMQAALDRPAAVPQWYVVLERQRRDHCGAA